MLHIYNSMSHQLGYTLYYEYQNETAGFGGFYCFLCSSLLCGASSVRYYLGHISLKKEDSVKKW